jgi:hypothetical protein
VELAGSYFGEQTQDVILGYAGVTQGVIVAEALAG